MRLSDHQSAFTSDLARLICLVPSMMPGYRVRLSYAERSNEEQARLHKANPAGAVEAGKSQHNKRLAADLLLDKRTESGWEWITTSGEYLVLGAQWETMSAWNRSGIRFKDGGHFERLEHLREERDSLHA